MLKIRLLKALDRYLGTVAACLAPRPGRGTPVEPRRVLLIRPGGIGDAVLLVPAIRALKDRFPGCVIDVLAEKRNAAVFSLCDRVDRTLRYDSLSGMLSVIRKHYDVVIDTEQWHRLSAVLARMTGAPFLIGFDTNIRRRLFSRAVSYSHDTYEACSFFSLLAPLGIPVQEQFQVPYIHCSTKAEEEASAQLAPLGGRPFIALFPGASIPERRWGAEKFRELAGRFGARGIPVVVVGAAGDRDTGNRIVAGGDGVNLAGKTSLMVTAAILGHARLVVSGDSGILHIAVGMGVPTVSLFGPGIAKKWAPKGDRHRVVNLRLPCSPCTRFGSTPPCPRGAPCISDIGVDVVEKAAAALMADPRTE